MSSSKVSKTKSAGESNQSAGGKPEILKLAIAKAKNIDVQEPNLKSEGKQNIAFVRYNHAKDGEVKSITPLFQTGTFKITQHGIPDIHEEYHPDDSKRNFMKVPLDPSQPACVEMHAFLEDVDEMMSSPETFTKLFGKKKDKYVYQPCVRSHKIKDNDDDDEDAPKKKKLSKDATKAPKEIFKFCKMYFSNNYETQELMVTLYEKNTKGDEGKAEPKTVTDLCTYIRYQSEIRMAFLISKIWINKSAAAGSDKILWGVGFKILQIQYTPNVKTSTRPTGNVFHSDEEETTPDVKESKKSSKAIKADDSDSDDEIDNKKKNTKLDDSDDDIPVEKGSDSEASSDEVEPEPVKKSSKASKKSSVKAKVIDSDEDEVEGESSDDEPKIATKPSKKASKVDSDDDEPKKKPSKSTKKAAVKEDSDDEVEEEEVKVVAKKSSKPAKKASK
jgi:hypothetical protein